MLRQHPESEIVAGAKNQEQADDHQPARSGADGFVRECLAEFCGGVAGGEDEEPTRKGEDRRGQRELENDWQVGGDRAGEIDARESRVIRPPRHTDPIGSKRGRQAGDDFPADDPVPHEFECEDRSSERSAEDGTKASGDSTE